MKEVKQMIKKLEWEREGLWDKLDRNRKELENARDRLYNLEVEQANKDILEKL